MTPEEQEYQEYQEYLAYLDSQNTQSVAASTAQADDNSSVQAGIMGASKGYLKNIGNVVTAPVDLAFRGLNYAADKLGMAPGISSEDMPSNMVGRVVDAFTEGYPSNRTAEKIGSGVGTVAGLVANPYSATRAAMGATAAETTTLPAIVGEAAQYARPAMGLVPRATTVGAVSAAESALTNAALAAKDPNANLGVEAAKGAVTGLATGLIPPVVGELAGDIAPVMQRASDRAFERSMGASSKDFTRSQKMAGSYPDVDAGTLETQTSNAFRGVRNEGIIPTVGTQVGKATLVNQARDAVGQEISGIVRSIDEAGIRPEIRFDNLERLVNNTPFTQRADVRRQVEAVRETLGEWNGSAVQLHEGKSALGRLGYTQAPGSAPSQVSGAVQRAAERDFREALGISLQQGIDAGRIRPETMQAFLEANARYGNLARVSRVVEPAAIAAQHQNVPMWQKAVSATGYGLPMAAAYSKYGLPGAIGVGTVGVLERTSTGQALEAMMAQGTATGLRTLEQLADNPYSVMGLQAAALPRNWEDVKGDGAAKATIAMNAGLAPEVYNSMPEPLQQEIHKQIILSNPDAAEPSEGNLSIVNNEYQNPMEKDAVVKQHLSADGATRARVIGSSFQNKYVPPQPEPQMPPMPPRALPSVMEKVNKWSRERIQPEPRATGSTDMLSQMEELTRNKLDHAQDR